MLRLVDQSEVGMSSGSATVSTPPSTLVEFLWPAQASRVSVAARTAVLLALGNTLLVISAKVQVPIPPVPVTLQSLVVLLLGAVYGWRLGTATVLLYLVEGALGLPVFAGPSAGPLYMAGPTGGFLAGFAAATLVVGLLAERGWDQPLPRLLALMALGHAVLFAFGLAWLAVLVGPAKAWAVGALPFLWATALKTALAAALMQAGWSFARR
jgi:biotin transport system substrate-specific component